MPALLRRPPPAATAPTRAPTWCSTGVFSCSAHCTSSRTRVDRACALFLRTSGNAGTAHAQRTRRLRRLPAPRSPALTIHAASSVHLDLPHFNGASALGLSCPGIHPYTGGVPVFWMHLRRYVELWSRAARTSFSRSQAWRRCPRLASAFSSPIARPARLSPTPPLSSGRRGTVEALSCSSRNCANDGAASVRARRRAPLSIEQTLHPSRRAAVG